MKTAQEIKAEIQRRLHELEERYGTHDQIIEQMREIHIYDAIDAMQLSRLQEIDGDMCIYLSLLKFIEQ